MSERVVSDAAFGEIVELVAAARQRAVQAVNTTLIAGFLLSATRGCRANEPSHCDRSIA